MIGWFNKKIKRKRISGSFVLEILPPLTIAIRSVSINRRRCQRIAKKDITELSVSDLILHIEKIEDNLRETESHLKNVNDRITRERM